MDSPIYHLDFLNNRMLIALIAIIHVVINHGMAVGGIPLVTYLENKGIKTGEAKWDVLAKRLMFIFFIITTTMGAMSGVGIWFSVSLVNPVAIGSLLRVFFWAWSLEWVVFITEVLLILWYFLSWKAPGHPQKKQHLKLGKALSIASWITMAIIVSILGFMMDTGSWKGEGSLFSAFFNPVYLPQLAFRTPLALLLAGAMALVVLVFLYMLPHKDELPTRSQVLPVFGRWMLVWAVPLVLGSLWYRSVIPKYSVGNISVAVGTQAFSAWYHQLMLVSAGVSLSVVVIAIFCVFLPQKIPTLVLLIPALGLTGMLGLFERVREFIRKPYAIQGYLYSNGYRVQDYAILNRDGILKHSTFYNIPKITNENKLEAGERVFLLACSRCHTVSGINSIRENVGRMYGFSEPWDKEKLSTYIGSMHNGRSFMPPFPGNNEEKSAVASYIVSLQWIITPLDGAQNKGLLNK